MTCLQMCSISSMVRLLGIVFPISVFFSMSGSGLHDGEPWPIEMLTFVENLRTVASSNLLVQILIPALADT